MEINRTDRKIKIDVSAMDIQYSRMDMRRKKADILYDAGKGAEEGIMLEPSHKTGQRRRSRSMPPNMENVIPHAPNVKNENPVRVAGLTSDGRKMFAGAAAKAEYSAPDAFVRVDSRNEQTKEQKRRAAQAMTSAGTQALKTGFSVSGIRNMVRSDRGRNVLAQSHFFMKIMGIMALVLMLAMLLFVLLFGAWANSQNIVSTEGLPAMIDSEMLAAVIETRDAYHVPASVTLAQLIRESGGHYGPGLSLLAYQYHNLFGVKWFGVGEYVVMDGCPYRIYDSYAESIEHHAQFLNGPRYMARTAGIDWTTIEGARKYAYAVKAAGYAEDPEYAEALIANMDQYDLYRYDTISLENVMFTGDGQDVADYRSIVTVRRIF